jgi:glycosyltransferase involved in cell wall biosynthesis
MVQVVHVISDLDTGGAEVMLSKLVDGMDRARFTNVVVSLTDRGQLGDRIEASGVIVHALGMRRGWPNAFALPRLVRLLRTLKPTIVQSWLYHADFLSTLAVKLSGHPLLLWNLRCSDMDLTHYRPLTCWIQRVLARWSATPTGVVVNSEAGRHEHERLGYHPRRWETIPNGFDLDLFRPDRGLRVMRRNEWRIPDDAVVVALVARVDPMKDHATFLEAACQVAQRRHDVYFVLIGKDTEKLAGAVAAKGLTDRVHVLGYRGDISSLLPGTDIVCLSSAFGEGFPNILGEAMACGIPCVSTDVGDAKRIIADTGLIVPPRSPSSLADAFIELIDRGPAVRAELGRAARQRITAEYSLQRIIEQYERLYLALSSSYQLRH